MNLKQYIDDVSDFPEKGVVFKDITRLIKTPKAFSETICQFIRIAKQSGANKIAAIDSRGFLFGAPVAHQLKIPLILIRKAGKLPKERHSESYDLEYGSAEIEVHRDDVGQGDKVMIIDDVFATGGTLRAAIKLIQKSGGEVAVAAILIELNFLDGRKKLKDISVESLIQCFQ